MRIAPFLFGLILVADLSGIASAAPINRTHRPWLMMGGHKQREVFSESEPETPQSDSLTPTPSSSDSRSITVENDPRATPEGSKVVKQALKYEGTRYRFGGTGKRGIDCSGLVARIYEDLKYKRVPHASAALYNSGSPVSLSALRPGDLVFFKNTYRRGISHVGIYAGSNKFIHASNRRHGVTVTALSDPYFQIHYAGARRLY